MLWSRAEAGHGDAAGSGAEYDVGRAGHVWLGGVGRAIMVEGGCWVASLMFV